MNWTKQEKGWYTNLQLGGIVRERGGWYWWPLDGDEPNAGPFKSLKKAIEYAEGKK